MILAATVFASGLHLSGDGSVGRAALDMTETKTQMGFAATLASGILANMLVCLAVWLSYSGQSTTDKILGVTLPIAAFVAAGFEHSIANMYLLSYGWMVQDLAGGDFWALVAQDPPATDAMSATSFLGNLVPATVGNLIGGSVVALAYCWTYGAPGAGRSSG